MYNLTKNAMKPSTCDTPSAVAASATSPAEHVPTVTTLHVDTFAAAANDVPLAEDDSPTPTATSFAAAPPSTPPVTEAEPETQPPPYDESKSSVQFATKSSSTTTTDRESARQAALSRGAPANASSSSDDPSSNGIADLLSRFAAMLFPKYAPSPAQVVVLGDDEAPVELLVKELVRPLLGEEAEVATVKMVRELTYVTAKAETHHVVAFPKVEGFMHKKVEHALESANQIYYLLDTQRPTSTPLPPYLLPYLKHITFICIHSLARPEKVSPKLFASLSLPAEKSVTILDGSSPDDLQAQFTTLWRAAGDIAREKRLDKLMEAQERARAKTSS